MSGFKKVRVTVVVDTIVDTDAINAVKLDLSDLGWGNPIREAQGQVLPNTYLFYEVEYVYANGYWEHA